MRVGLIAWDYPPSPSGLSTAAREIAESLCDAGAQVTVFAGDRAGRESAGGIDIIGCRPPEGGALARLRLYAGVGHLAAPLAFRRAVLGLHRETPFDLVEATNWYAPAALLAGRAPFPVVTRNSTPAIFSRDPATGLRDGCDGWAADRLEQRQARRSAGLISNTAEHGRRIVAAYGLGNAEMPHAVIGLSLAPATIERAGRASYPPMPAGEPLRLLFVGRAEARKGFDTILEAAGILDEECAAGALPPFVVQLAGVPESGLPSGLPPRVRRRFRPLGRISEDELDRRYAAAHAVLAPSRYESFGLVYQEGMAYGRPMVASNEDASARVFVGETGAGTMAERNTGEALASAIRPILRDPKTRERLRQNALRAAGRFTRETLGRETLALYARAIAGFHSR